MSRLGSVSFTWSSQLATVGKRMFSRAFSSHSRTMAALAAGTSRYGRGSLRRSSSSLSSSDHSSRSCCFRFLSFSSSESLNASESLSPFSSAANSWKGLKKCACGEREADSVRVLLVASLCLLAEL